MTTINFQGTIISLQRPIIMGVINLNQDSFYPESRQTDMKMVMKTTEKMLNEGADVIDIGGMSSRPGAEIIAEDIELKRIIDPILEITKNFPEAIISVDTIRSRIASEAVQSGARCVNDISAGNFDPLMIQTVGKLKVPYIMMHMAGLPSDMQLNPKYDDVVKDIMVFFKQKIQTAQRAGIQDIIIDPGFGFGKTIEHNYTLIKNFEVFSVFDLPLLAGVSRKSMIWKKLNITPSTALNGTTALHMYLLDRRVNILRVHDVREAKECIDLYTSIHS